MRVEMGMYVRDVITGYEGRVVSVAHYIAGCTRILVMPSKCPDGKRPEGEWIDEPCVQVDSLQSQVPLVLPGATVSQTGSERDAPKR